MDENELSRIIIGAAIEVHRILGPGLLESVYRDCLAYELRSRGLNVEQEKSLPICYKELQVPSAYRLDLLIEHKIIVELKAVDILLPVYSAQLLSYLRLTGLKLGLLINFNVEQLRQGVKRIVNNL